MIKEPGEIYNLSILYIWGLAADAWNCRFMQVVFSLFCLPA